MVQSSDNVYVKDCILDDNFKTDDAVVTGGLRADLASLSDLQEVGAWGSTITPTSKSGAYEKQTFTAACLQNGGPGDAYWNNRETSALCLSSSYGVLTLQLATKKS